MENIKNYIIEKQKEYKYGSDAYNLLRGLETTIPNMIKENLNMGDMVCSYLDKKAKEYKKDPEDLAITIDRFANTMDTISLEDNGYDGIDPVCIDSIKI